MHLIKRLCGSQQSKGCNRNPERYCHYEKKTGGKKVAITAIATDGSNKYASWKITSMKGVVKKVKINGKKRIKAGKNIKIKSKNISY